VHHVVVIVVLFVLHIVAAMIVAVAMMFKNVIELVMVLCVKGIEK
ncbi:3386_t:CDS:2, partial [Ambispora leptoticha]